MWNNIDIRNNNMLSVNIAYLCNVQISFISLCFSFSSLFFGWTAMLRKFFIPLFFLKIFIDLMTIDFFLFFIYIPSFPLYISIISSSHAHYWSWTRPLLFTFEHFYSNESSQLDIYYVLVCPSIYTYIYIYIVLLLDLLIVTCSKISFLRLIISNK